MFKFIKDGKIVGVSDEPFRGKIVGNSNGPCKGGASIDEQIEDTEHTVDDYEQYGGEYVLKTSVPVDYKNEQIRLQRQSRFAMESDPLYLDYVEAQARGDETVDEKKQLWLDKKDEIRAELPYAVEVKATTKKRKKASV